MKLEGSLKQIKDEFNGIDSSSGWNNIYLDIKKNSMYPELTCTEAKASLNKSLNRYRDVSPYDHSRVVILKGSCNYINASLVKVGKADRNYILTQGPLPQTAGHFWQMIWENKSKAVLMLNRVIEKNQIKCFQYWPNGDENGDTDEMFFEDVGLKIKLLSQSKYNNFIRRTFNIEELTSGDKMEVYQFHYMTWPDFGVPTSPMAFLHFLQAVRDSGALSSNVGPSIVHCSAGIGRSGTFCLVDSCLLMMEQGIDVNVKDILLEMRKFRMGLIQTPDQLRFSYLAIIEGAQHLANGFSSFPEDENGVIIDEDDSKPPIPKRVTSLRIGDTDHLDLQKMIERNMCELVEGNNRPLPPVPNNDDGQSEEDSDDDSDLIDDSGSGSDDLEDEDSEKGQEMEGLLNGDGEEEHNTTNSNNDSHQKTNGGIDEDLLRRRLKKEKTMEKLREIKTKQKEAEQRSPKTKRRKKNDDDDGEEEEEEDRTQEIV